MTPAGKYIFVEQETESALVGGLIVPFPKKLENGTIKEIPDDLETVLKVGDRIAWEGRAYEIDENTSTIQEQHVMYKL